MYYRIIFFSLILGLISCGGVKSKKMIENKEFISFDSLIDYDPYNKVKAVKYSHRIISYINVSCPSCIEEITRWTELSSKLSQYKCGIDLVCHSDDDFELFKYLCEKGDFKTFPHQFLLDNNNIFSGMNKVFVDPIADKTVLINSNDEVLAIGNPLHEKRVLENYLSKIDHVNNRSSLLGTQSSSDRKIFEKEHPTARLR